MKQYGLYLNCGKRRFDNDIFEKLKTQETRPRDVLKSMFSDAGADRVRVNVIITGLGSPFIAGRVDIHTGKFCPAKTLYKPETMEKTRVYPGGPYATTTGKYLYPLSHAVRTIPRPVPANRENHGRSWTCREEPVSVPFCQKSARKLGTEVIKLLSDYSPYDFCLEDIPEQKRVYTAAIMNHDDAVIYDLKCFLSDIESDDAAGYKTRAENLINDIENYWRA